MYRRRKHNFCNTYKILLVLMFIRYIGKENTTIMTRNRRYSHDIWKLKLSNDTTLSRNRQNRNSDLDFYIEESVTLMTNLEVMNKINTENDYNSTREFKSQIEFFINMGDKQPEKMESYVHLCPLFTYHRHKCVCGGYKH